MIDRYRMSPHLILDSLGNVIFSPELVDGHWRSLWPDGHKTMTCGPALAHASLPGKAHDLTVALARQGQLRLQSC